MIIAARCKLMSWELDFRWKMREREISALVVKIFKLLIRCDTTVQTESLWLGATRLSDRSNSDPFFSVFNSIRYPKSCFVKEEGAKLGHSAFQSSEARHSKRLCQGFFLGFRVIGCDHHQQQSQQGIAHEAKKWRKKREGDVGAEPTSTSSWWNLSMPLGMDASPAPSQWVNFHNLCLLWSEP